MQVLYDFARVHGAAGKSVTISLNATATTFTQVDELGVRYKLAGSYGFQFGTPEAASLGQGFAEHAVWAR